jgi:predicted ferric reductase
MLSDMNDNTDSTLVPNIDDVRANASLANLDPFKFSHGLTGVDQPLNYLFVHILILTALVPALLALTYRLLHDNFYEQRRAAAITSSRLSRQYRDDRYARWGVFKRYFLYAPIWTRRHDDERQSSDTSNKGTTPTVPQTTIIFMYVISNIAYCVAIPSQPRPKKLAEFRGRCGTLAAFNLVFTILFAIRNNPLIRILHVSYDTFNAFHRWTARLVVLESIAHVCAFALNAYDVTYDGRDGWSSINWVLQHSLSYRTGLTAFISFILLIVHSIRPLRHAFYETFLTLHRLGAIVAISGLYFHLAKHALPQLPWMYIIITLLAMETLIRMSRILYHNWSWKHRTWTHVALEALPGGATRVTFSLSQSWNAKPGSHVHVYLPRIALWSSHPFSIAWSDSQSSSYTRLDSEKLSSSSEDPVYKQGSSTVSCIIRARSGMTRTLFELASGSAAVSIWAAIEGPYGGFHSLESYGTVVLFAAGVSITHQLPFVRHLLAGHTSNTAATQKILLVWSIRHIEALEWVEPWLEELADMRHFREVVRIRLYVSRLTLDGRPNPEYLQVRPGRCDPQEVVDEEVLAQVGAMAVSVCGPASFNNSVRAAVRKRVCIRNIDFFEEAFSY